MRKVLAVLLGFFSLFSSLFVFAAIDDIVSGDSDTGTGILIGLAIFFGAITALSGYGTVRLWKKKAFDPVSVEPLLLQLASRHQGRITVAEAAVGLRVPVKHARLALEHLLREGAAETLVSPSGELVYSVNGLLGAGDKAQAKGVLES